MLCIFIVKFIDLQKIVNDLPGYWAVMAWFDQQKAATCATPTVTPLVFSQLRGQSLNQATGWLSPFPVRPPNVVVPATLPGQGIVRGVNSQLKTSIWTSIASPLDRWNQARDICTIALTLRSAEALDPNWLTRLWSNLSWILATTLKGSWSP